MKNVLLLSAYHAPSHARWCRGVMDYFDDWHWQLESLPARFFNWRSRGNSLTWGLGDFPALTQNYDLVVATSMVDLATLRGLRRNLFVAPCVVYFHENQFAYPKARQQQGLLEIQLTSIYTALAADQILFNSHYNRESFLAGAQALLAKMPDGVPGGLVSQLAQRSSVLPVPMDDSFYPAQQTPWRGGPVELIWNHRWEWDKGPDLLLLLAQQLAGHGLLGAKYRFHVVGQQFRSHPQEFAELKDLLCQHDALGQWGFVDQADQYQQLLSQCHAVLSTARHDFQGLAVQEATLLGCLPFVPNRLVYPEWFGTELCYDSHENDSQAEVAGLVRRLEMVFAQDNAKRRQVASAGPLKLDLSWRQLGPQYRHHFTTG